MTDVSPKANNPRHAPPERWQHGTNPEVGDDGVQRVQRPVDVLLRAGKIAPEHQIAAARYYEDYAIAWECAIEFRSSHLDPHIAYFHARHAVGYPGRSILALAVLSDVTVANLATFYGVPVDRAETWIVDALKRLTRAYAEMDGAAPAPTTNIRAAGVK